MNVSAMSFKVYSITDSQYLPYLKNQMEQNKLQHTKDWSMQYNKVLVTEAYEAVSLD